jgi:two-component system cell cycle response regulator DivK
MSRILIVEDNEDNRLLLHDILTARGYEVLEAVNGVEGIAMAGREMPDLILMDIQMPAMNGLEAGKILKQQEATRSIKLVAITSFAMSGDRERILEAGFDGYLSKPIDTRQLPILVGRLLSPGE